MIDRECRKAHVASSAPVTKRDEGTRRRNMASGQRATSLAAQLTVVSGGRWSPVGSVACRIGSHTPPGPPTQPKSSAGPSFQCLSSVKIITHIQGHCMRLRRCRTSLDLMRLLSFRGIINRHIIHFKLYNLVINKPTFPKPRFLVSRYFPVSRAILL